MTPEKIAELAALQQEASDGLLRAKALVSSAESPDSAFHDDFEWDDTEAGRLYRIDQARQIIRSAVSVLPMGNQPPMLVRTYVSLPTDRAHGGGYRPIATVITDEQLLAEAVADIGRTVERLCVKYAVFNPLRLFLEELREKLGELDAPPPKPEPKKKRKQAAPPSVSIK